MKIYVLGNEDISFDNAAIKAAKQLENDFKEVNCVFVKPNEDVPFVNEKNVLILDVVSGINKVEYIDDIDVDVFKLSPRYSAHDFDLNFQLRYLKKINKLGKVSIIGLPLGKSPDYSSIHSIVKKLVAQDIQGS